MEYKNQFKEIVKQNIHREGINQLMERLERSDFFDAPASTNHHEAYEGGLVEHSVKVWRKLCEIVPAGKYDPETLTIVALFHDVCKVGYYTTEMRNKKIDGKWVQVPFYTVDDKFPYGHGEKSVYLLNQVIKLTEEEAVSIRFHMGAYEGQNIWNTLGNAYKKYPLAFYLHMADMKATYEIE